MTRRTRRGTAELAAGALSLLFCARCNVYDASLLGAQGTDVGGNAPIGRSGSSGTTAGGDSGNAGGHHAGAAGNDSSAGGSSGAPIAAAGMIENGGRTGSAGKAGSDTVSGGAGVGGASGASGNAGGTGGTGGTGGNAAGTGGAAAGSAGSGVGGTTQSANGCAKLSVPLDDAADKAHFAISLTSPVDLSGATLTMRLYVQAGVGGSIFNYVQDSGTYHFLGVATAQRHLLSSFSGWSTVTWDVGAEPDAAATGIVKTSIKNVGIELSAQPSTNWTNPTIVYIDSILVTTPALSFTLDATSSVNSTPMTTSASGQALWLNSGTLDTTAASAALSWQATCP